MNSNNETITITAKRIPGLTDLVLKDGIVTNFSGMLFEIWNEIAKANNYKFNVVLGEDELVGSAINIEGTVFNGMIGMIQNNLADIVVAPVSITPQRASVVEFTIPLYEDATCAFTPSVNNKGANRYFKIFEPFDYRVWLCIITAIFLYSLILYSIHHFVTKNETEFLNSNEYKANFGAHQTSFGMYFFFMFGRILTEDLGMHHLIYLKSERLLLCFWWVFGIVINSLYTSILVSLLLITKYEPIITAVEDLAKLDSYTLCMQEGGYQLELLTKATNPLYKEILSYTERNPLRVEKIKLAQNIFEKSFKGECFGFVDYMVGRIMMSRIKSQNITCVDYWGPANIAFAYKKDWKHAKNITKTLTKLHETGVISLIIRNCLNSVAAKTTQVNERTVIHVENLFSVFVLYSIAISISILVQLLEIFYKKRTVGTLFKFFKEFKERKN